MTCCNYKREKKQQFLTAINTIPPLFAAGLQSELFDGARGPRDRRKLGSRSVRSMVGTTTSFEALSRFVLAMSLWIFFRINLRNLNNPMSINSKCLILNVIAPFLYSASNQLVTLPPEIGQLECLTILELQDNALNSLPQEMEALCNLVRLNLSRNSLTELPESICNLKDLKVCASVYESS